MALRCSRLVVREALVARGVAARSRGIRSSFAPSSFSPDQQKNPPPSSVRSSPTAALQCSSKAVASSAACIARIPQPANICRSQGLFGAERRQAGGLAARLLSSGTLSSLLGDDGFDPFVTHHNAEDADRADRMVRDYVKRRLAGGGGIEIRKDFCRGALNSYRVLSEKAAERARRVGKRPDTTFAKKGADLLSFVEEAYDKDPALSPDAKSYNMVVDAYAKIGEPERAEALLLRLEKLWKAGNEKVKPDTILYNSLIDAWAKSGRKEAPMRAEAILEHMEQLNQQGHEGVCPDYINYNAVINAWAKSREKGAAQRAEAILSHMLKLHEGGREECRPNTRSFNSVIDAWARSKDRNAPKRAEALIHKMEELYRQGNKEVFPNTISYNAVINAWAKSREKGAAVRAAAILNHMLKLQEAGREECRPNTRSFTAVIDAWTKSRDKNAYSHALKIFQQMQSMGKAAEPNSVTYNSLINTLAVSSVPDKAAKAFDILLEMENMAHKGNEAIAPNIITYSAVMKACVRTSGNNQAKRKALRVALETFDKLRRSSQLSSADPMVYDSLFITIANASKGSEYAKMVGQVFKFCCEDGVLDDWILQNFRRNSPKEVFEKLIGSQGSGGRDVSVADLPPEWSRSTKSR